MNGIRAKKQILLQTRRSSGLLAVLRCRRRHNVATAHEHRHRELLGGFAQDDTNAMLLVSHPDIEARTVTSFVETSQVAPTILKALGLDLRDLEAVRKEGTPALPGLFSR